MTRKKVVPEEDDRKYESAEGGVLYLKDHVANNHERWQHIVEMCVEPRVDEETGVFGIAPCEDAYEILVAVHYITWGYGPGRCSECAQMHDKMDAAIEAVNNIDTELTPDVVERIKWKS